MRQWFFVVITLTALAVAQPAFSSTIVVNALEGDFQGVPADMQGGGCRTCIAFTETPIYTFSAGDTVDFGTITLQGYLIPYAASGGAFILGYFPQIRVMFDGATSPRIS